MEIINLNKYILKHIFSYVNFKTQLNLVKYSNKFMSKLDITKNSFQKYYFNILITPFLLENRSLLYENNVLDKKTLIKLLSEFDKDRAKIHPDYNLFKKPTDFKMIKDNPRLMTNILELNLSNVKNLELPCMILNNLEKLSLRDISGIKFITNNSNPNITLRKLKYLYLNRVFFEKNQNINIKADNLVFLDIRMKERIYDFNKLKFDNLENIRNIFNLDFFSVFLDNINNANYYTKINALNNPKKLFSQENSILTKLDYFNFEIDIELKENSDYVEPGQYSLLAYNFPYNSAISNSINLKHMFTKTKNNKFLFESNFGNKLLRKFTSYKLTYVQQRICDSNNYNNYYFINRDINLSFDFDQSDPYIDTGGYLEEAQFDQIKFLNEELNVNSFRIKGNVLSPDGMNFLNSIGKNKDNMLEKLEFIKVDSSNFEKFIYNLRKFKKLKIFKITDCLLKNDEFTAIFKCLSECKYLLSIEVYFSNNSKLYQQAKEFITKSFPGVSIDTKSFNSYIKWKKNQKNQITKKTK